MTSITNIEKNNSYLKIIWSDGEESKFNFMWLRDNCPTAHDKNSRHRMFNILNVSEKLNPKKYMVNSDGKLEIEWPNQAGPVLMQGPALKVFHGEIDI